MSRSRRAARQTAALAAAALLALAADLPAQPAQAEADLAGGGAAADAAAIRAALEAWTEDFNERRSDRVCDLFAPDLRSNYRGQPENDFGRLCEGLHAALTDPERRYRYRLELEEVLVSGDMGIARLVWHLTITDGSGRTVESSDRGLDVFLRQPDGAWRISRFLAYEQ